MQKSGGTGAGRLEEVEADAGPGLQEQAGRMHKNLDCSNVCCPHPLCHFCAIPPPHASCATALLAAEQGGGAASAASAASAAASAAAPDPRQQVAARAAAAAALRRLLAARAPQDGGSAWRPLSRYLLAAQAFVSQVGPPHSVFQATHTHPPTPHTHTRSTTVLHLRSCSQPHLAPAPPKLQWNPIL